MDGLLIIDKPAGITSHDVVSRVRRILKTKRVGHTGTLDPFATGVMVVLVGKATRLAQFLDKDEKEYEAVIQFGFETDTGDLTGVNTQDNGMPSSDVSERLSAADWEGVLESFRGEIDQIPPMYSAKKIDGKKLYEHARKGEVIEREHRRVTITKLVLADQPNDRSQIKIEVACTAGTYIRTLAEDIGRKIAIGAHLAKLRRTRAGSFLISQGISLDDLSALQDPSACLLPMETAVKHLPAIMLAADRIEKTKGGLPTRVIDPGWNDKAFIRMLDEKDTLVAIGVFLKQENAVKPKIVLV
jgi:tRNA pseudouridine55 synthase